MPSVLVALAVTLIGQGFDAPDDKPRPVRVVGDAPPATWLASSGVIDTGIKGNDAYLDGHFSITAPVFSDIGKEGTLGGSLVFVEPYVSWGEQGEVATSLGIGVRHFWNDQPLNVLNQPRKPGSWLDEGIMLGWNGFVDMLSTQTHQQFWQLGTGLELATRYIEWRANYYHPLSGQKEVEDHFLRYDGREQRLTSGETPFARGHTIQQDVTFTTYDLYTETIFRRYEEGLKGWDAEAAFLLPWLDQWTELWLIAGYANFDNKPFGPQLHGTGPVKGWKAGIEWRPLPQLVLSATWFEDKAMAGGDWTAGVGLQIPLDPEPSNPGKSWWRKLKDSMKPGSRHLVERAAVPVHRQNAAIKVGTSFEKPEVKHHEKVVSERTARLLIASNVIFVNNSGRPNSGVAAHGSFENGTAEHPFDTIQEGTDMATTAANQRNKTTPTVFVAGGGAPYQEVIRIDGASVHYASGGYGVAGAAGKFFGLGPPAHVIGESASGAERGVVAGINGNIYSSGGSSRSFWIDGFRLDGYVLALNVHDVRIRGNRIGNSSSSIDIETSGIGGNFYFDVSGNVLESELGLAIIMGGSTPQIQAPPAHVVTNISGNVFNIVDSPQIGSGFAITLVIADGNVVMDAFLSSNTIHGAAVALSQPFSLSASSGTNVGVLRLHSGLSNTLIGFSASEPPYSVFSLEGITGDLIINNRVYLFP